MFERNYLKLYYHFGYNYNLFKKYYEKGMLHLNDIQPFIEGFDICGFDVFYESIEKYKRITIEESCYPESLRKIQDPPFLLFYSGDLNLLEERIVSVVGTRAPDEYGIKAGVELCEKISSDGTVIVSGMARGVDRVAHIGGLRVSGKTIAVMANGLNRCYPAEHDTLKAAILKKGLVLTEFLPDEKPKRFYFPWRNRIVAGLSQSLVVIQCEIKSGTMTTVNWALEQGKEVFVLPGDVFRKMSSGCNYLIGLGATPIFDLENSIISVKNEETS